MRLQVAAEDKLQGTPPSNAADPLQISSIPSSLEPVTLSFDFQ